MATHLTEPVKFRIDSDLKRELEELAKNGDRTLAAEMRRALRKHVRDSQAEEQVA